MKKYYNSKENRWYIEGRSITVNTDRGFFSGIPSEQQLEEWGYRLHIEPQPQLMSEEALDDMNKQRRMNAIKTELADTDYLVLKAYEGYDMSEYGDWQGKRKALRDEYNELEEYFNSKYAAIAEDIEFKDIES